MAEENLAPAPSTESSPTGSTATEIVPTNSGTESYSAREAANALTQYRGKRDSGVEREAEAASPAESTRTGTSERKVPEVTEGVPGQEQSQGAQPAGEPVAIEPPRSWSNEDKQWFAALPPETQEVLARRENERDTALRRGQNEVATQRQSFAAQRQQMEAMRVQYEKIMPALQAALMQQQQGQFGDIKSMADVENLARTDWQRYALWDAHQKKVSAVQAEIGAIQQRQQAEYSQRWNEFANAEDQKFLAKAPEMNNPAEASRIANASLSYLRGLEFSDENLSDLWAGRASFSLRDARVQLLVRDAALYRQAKASVPARKSTPVPKVQRPGSPAERVPDADASLTALDNRLESTGKWKDAAELLLARRAARR